MSTTRILTKRTHQFEYRLVSVRFSAQPSLSVCSQASSLLITVFKFTLSVYSSNNLSMLELLLDYKLRYHCNINIKRII